MVVIGMAEAGLVVVGMAVGNEVGFSEGENVDGVTDVGWVVKVEVGVNVDDWEVGALVGINVVGCDVGFEVGIDVVGLNDVGWDVGMVLGVTDGCAKRGVKYRNDKKQHPHFVPTGSCTPYHRRGFSRGRSTKGWRGQRSGYPCWALRCARHGATKTHRWKFRFNFLACGCLTVTLGTL